MSLEAYYFVHKVIKYCPYFIRWSFWTLLYYYNKRKHPNGDFTLKLYQSYAIL